MEKLKAKHDHKLTDILKVAIFGLMLILPGLILLPSMLYYGVNEHATAPTEQVEKIEYERVDFNQKSKIINSDNYVKWAPEILGNDATFNDNEIYFYGNALAVPKFSNDHDSYYFINNHKYLFSFDYDNNMDATTEVKVYIPPSRTETIPTSSGKFQNIYTCNNTSYNDINFQVNNFVSGTMYIRNVEVFDLTQMFGSGNEPTIQEFNSYYPNDYYEYTESRYEILEIPTGTYETYTDITSQIQYNWNSLWQQPLFSWTNYTILKQGLDNFTYVFGITQTSYINNLITYELIMVAIYIVIDIVLTLFKWLTHLIGEK